MLVHTVLFWLKNDLTPAQKNLFHEKLQDLKKIESCHAVYIGKPATTEKRPVIDCSYSAALTVLFKSVVEHDQYQVHPLHDAFLKNCKKLWEKVQIYDAE